MIQLSKWHQTITSALYLGLALTVRAQSKLPDGEGKQLVERSCAKCHTLEGIVNARLSKERWAYVIDDMVLRGAEGTDVELNLMIEYLAKNFGPDKPAAKVSPTKVNVNRAPVRELAAILTISNETALAIVRDREKNGNFTHWQELKRVPGIDMKQIEMNRNRIEF